MEQGYYVIKIKIGNLNIYETTIGYNDGSSNLPWTMVGSDEIYDDSEIETMSVKLSLDTLIRGK